MNFTRSALNQAVLVLIATSMLTACGGSSDEAPTPTPPVSGNPDPVPPVTPPVTPPASAIEVAFGSIAAGKSTTEGGIVSDYAYSEKAGKYVITPYDSVAGSVTLVGTLSDTNSYAGIAARIQAAGNLNPDAVAADRKTIDASTRQKLVLTLSSSTDTALQVRLQPKAAPESGCAVQADITVSATPTEYVLNLNTDTFKLPSWCASTDGESLAATLAGLFAVDVINPAAQAGKHDIRVGAIGFAGGTTPPVVVDPPPVVEPPPVVTPPPVVEPPPVVTQPTPPADNAQLSFDGTQVDTLKAAGALYSDDANMLKSGSQAIDFAVDTAVARPGAGSSSLKISGTTGEAKYSSEYVSAFRVKLDGGNTIDFSSKTITVYFQVPAEAQNVQVILLDANYQPSQGKYTGIALTDGWMAVSFKPSDASQINYQSSSFDITKVAQVELHSKYAGPAAAVVWHVDSISW